MNRDDGRPDAGAAGGAVAVAALAIVLGGVRLGVPRPSSVEPTAAAP
jgi:hypothetical protein